MFGNRAFQGTWVRDALIVAAAVGLGLISGKAFGVEPPPAKMDKQIDVLEKIIDQVLIDSPNFFVSGRGNTRGLYVKEFGVIFTFDASLVEKDKDWNFDFDGGFEVKEIDGKKVIVIDDEEVEEAEEAAREAARERNSSKGSSAQERLYKRGKAELVDTLLDYGDTLASLEKGKWVAVVAFLHDARYFAEQDMSKLTLKARIDDLRLYAADKLTEEEMVKRIVEAEY
jgi:hypothetical protein